MLPDEELARHRDHLEKMVEERTAELKALNWHLKQQITERRQAEEKRQTILKTALDGFWLVNLEGKLLEVNDSYCKMVGYTREELLNMSIPDLEAIESPEEVAQRIAKIMAQGYDRFESRHKRKDGQIIDVEISVNYLGVGEGQMFVFACDITERKRAEEELREARDKAQKYLDIAGVIIVAIDSEGKVTLINRRGSEVLGYKAEEVIGQNWFDLVVPPRIKEDLLAVSRKLLLGEIEPVEFYENPVLTKSGEERLIAWHNTVLRDERGNIIGHLSSGEDITERKRAEGAVRESEEKLRKMFESVTDGIIVVDLDGIIIEVNQRAVELYGASSRDEILGKSAFELVAPGDHEKIAANMRKALKGGIIGGVEYTLLKADGAEFPAELGTSVLKDASGKAIGHITISRDITERKRAEETVRESEEKYRGLITNVKLGVFRSTPEPTGKFLEVNPAMTEITGYSREELLEMDVADLHVDPEERGLLLEEVASGKGRPTREVRLKEKDGTEIVVSDTKVAVRDDGGKIIYFDGILEDITERKQAEEREEELQQELNRASRLAAVGELAAGVAHEMNNPLTGIMGFSERLLRKSNEDETRESVDIIHREAQRLAKVVQNLLTFARQREPTKEFADINEIVQKTLELRAYELKSSNIEVVLDLAVNLPQIMVDFHQIQEVFLNIILNAEQAMTETNGGGKLTIKSRPIKDYIRISFADDGPGIPAEHLDRVFNPFFTTKGERGGTGLGLSVCHGIVIEHGGRIYARSKPGSGANFLVDLPLTSRKIGESQIGKAQLSI